MHFPLRLFSAELLFNKFVVIEILIVRNSKSVITRFLGPARFLIRAAFRARFCIRRHIRATNWTDIRWHSRRLDSFFVRVNIYEARQVNPSAHHPSQASWRNHAIHNEPHFETKPICSNTKRIVYLARCPR